jgi:predicted house-cleaning noncanonical NTP pyrophosphatase (MazG superfamily)
MAKFYYGADGKGKLVRDKLDEVIRKQGYKVSARQLEPVVLAAEILKKMPEELAELEEARVSGDREEELKELADVLTLLDAYKMVRGLEESEVEAAKAQKIARAGGFKRGTFIEWVELVPGAEDYDYWLQHFRDNAERYLEAD